MKKTAISRGIITMVAACALVASSTMSASASTSADEDVAQLIERVAPNQGEVVPLEKSGAQTWTTGGAGASIPLDPAEPIGIDGGGQKLEITLPQSLKLQDGRATSDGTIVYQSNGSDVDAAVQSMHDGTVRVQTIIQAPTAAHEFSYGIGAGFQPVEAADGSMWVVGFTEAGEYQAFSVGTAWARDANGSEVSTHYEIRGNEIVQIVTPSDDTAYPIVADPTWQWYSAAYGAGFSKSETRAMASAGSSTGFCVLVPGGALKVACAVAGAYWFTQAGLAANAGGCVFLAAAPAPLAMRWVSPECR
jgi:hypothetical protein